MYINETTDNVRKLIEELESKDDFFKLKFLIYTFGLLNNNQINNKNETNPDLELDDLKVFNLERIGLENNVCITLLQNFVTHYNDMTKYKEAYEYCGNILGVYYNKEDKRILSMFEKLDFDEKLDAFCEIIIRYDNETYFDSIKIMASFDLRLSGYDIAKKIKDYKI